MKEMVILNRPECFDFLAFLHISQKSMQFIGIAEMSSCVFILDKTAKQESQFQSHMILLP